MTDIHHNMTIMDLNFGRCTREENQPGRAASPQAAVHLALNTPHSDGEYARQAQANGALGTERPTRPLALNILLRNPISELWKEQEKRFL